MSNFNLMSAYTKDKRLSREHLGQLPLPPSRGRFHRPVPFVDFVNEVEHQLDRIGLHAIQEEHLVGHEGQRHFGLMEVAPREGELITADDWRILIGLRGSHDQSVQRGLALGRQVMVCSNLCFSGDLYTSNTKQTTNIMSRLPAMIYSAVSQIPEMAHLEEQRVQRFKEFTMKPRWGDAALVEVHRRGGLNGAQLSRAIHEWDRPAHEEFTENGYTAWRLEQAVTEAVKPTGSTSNLHTVQNRTQIASSFLNEVVGF